MQKMRWKHAALDSFPIPQKAAVRFQVAGTVVVVQNSHKLTLSPARRGPCRIASSDRPTAKDTRPSARLARSRMDD